MSKMSTVGAQIAWANYEGKKLHELLSLTNRYSKRVCNHRSIKLNMLKALILKFKPRSLEHAGGEHGVSGGKKIYLLLPSTKT